MMVHSHDYPSTPYFAKKTTMTPGHETFFVVVVNPPSIHPSLDTP